MNAAYKARKVHFKRQEDDMIQFTNELKEEIKNVFVYKSMQLSKIIVYSNTWYSTLNVKKGTLNKRALKERMRIPADLS